VWKKRSHNSEVNKYLNQKLYLKSQESNEHRNQTNKTEAHKMSSTRSEGGVNISNNTAIQILDRSIGDIDGIEVIFKEEIIESVELSRRDRQWGGKHKPVDGFGARRGGERARVIIVAL
jgi:hypothetical protein